MEKIKILMTGCGAPGGAGVIKCLLKDDRFDLIVGDCNAEASGRFLAKKFVLLPTANDPDFIEKIIDICRVEGVEIIFPLVTNELFKFSQNLHVFEALKIKVIVSPYDGLKVANDKIALYQHLEKFSIDLPKYRKAENLNELIAAVNKLGYPDQSVVVKPGISNGSRGVRILDEKKSDFDLLFNEKPGSLYTNLTALESLIGANKIPEMLVSEYLPGDELTVDSIVSKGKVKIILIRTRDKMNGGISVAGKFIESELIEGYCLQVLNSLNLNGPIGLQVKKSVNGSYKLLEINPRIQGTSVAALGLGINLPLLSVYETLGWDAEYPVCRSGVGFVRVYDEVYYKV